MKSISEIISVLLIVIIVIALLGLVWYFLLGVSKKGEFLIINSQCDPSTKIIKIVASYLGSDAIPSDVSITVRDKITGNTLSLTPKIYKGEKCTSIDFIGLSGCNISASNSNPITNGEIVGIIVNYSSSPNSQIDIVIRVFGQKISFSSVTCSYQGLVMWLKMDEGSGNIAYDSSGNGNDGIIYNAVWVNGKIGKALEFNGANSYVEVPYLRYREPFYGFTFTAWVNYLADTGEIQQVFEAHTSGWEIFVEGDFPQLIFLITDNTGTRHYISTYLSSLNTWYHVAATYDGTFQKLYVNGQEVASSSWSSIFSISSLGLTLGKDYEANIQYLRGILDDVKIYNRALSAEEIKAIFESS